MIILFCGALANFTRPWFEWLFAALRARSGRAPAASAAEA
jgi:general nucleoside transport system permease protein